MKNNSVNIEKSVSERRISFIGSIFLWLVITATTVGICEIFTYALALDFLRPPVYIAAAAVAAASVFAAKCFYRAPWNFLIPIAVTAAAFIFRSSISAGFHNVTNIMNASFSGPLNIVHTTFFICAAAAYVALMLTVCGGFMMNSLLYLIICVPFMFVCVETWRINLPALLAVISCIWGIFAVNGMNKSARREKDIRTDNEKTSSAGTVAFAAACIFILACAAVRVIVPPQRLVGMADLTDQTYSREMADNLADNIVDTLDIPDEVVNPPEYTDIPPDIDLSAFEIAGIPTPEITPTPEPEPEPSEEPEPEQSEEPEPSEEPNGESDTEESEGSIPWTAIIIAVIIALAVAARIFSEKLRLFVWTRMTPDRACISVFKRICRIMKYAGIDSEYTTLTEWEQNAPLNCKRELHIVADNCRKCAYSPHKLTRAEANRSIAAYDIVRREIKSRINIIKRIFIV